MILCRRGKAEAALQSLREIMGKLKLTVNEEKTRICKVPEGEFDFLESACCRRRWQSVTSKRQSVRPMADAARRWFAAIFKR